MMKTERKICTFYLDKLYFGIDVGQIQEVIRYQEMTEVPLTSPVLRGLINMRGQIVTAIDMRKRLDFPEREAEEKPTNIIVRTEDGGVSLLVDGIGDVIDIDSELFETPPESLEGPIRQVLQEVCQLQKHLLLILDINQVLNIQDEKSESVTN